MDNAALRNYKDLLQQYNKITETCFSHCINTIGERSIAPDELKCIDFCTIKHIRVNHKVMSVYLEVQPTIMNRRIEEISEVQASLVGPQDANAIPNASGVKEQIQQPIESNQHQPQSMTAQS